MKQYESIFVYKFKLLQFYNDETTKLLRLNSSSTNIANGYAIEICSENLGKICKSLMLIFGMQTWVAYRHVRHRSGLRTTNI